MTEQPPIGAAEAAEVDQPRARFPRWLSFSAAKTGKRIDTHALMAFSATTGHWRSSAAAIRGRCRTKFPGFDVHQLRPYTRRLRCMQKPRAERPRECLGERAMFRNILVHIPSERPVRPVIEVAVALTMARRSHLDAVAIGYESTGTVGMLVGGGGAAIAAVVGAEQERAQERADAAISVFEVEAKLAEIAYGVRSLAAIPAEAGETIGALARLYDMTIVLQPDSSKFSYDNDIPQEILFNSGGPMLMVPYIHKGPLDTHHVGIAWDGSRLAARALRDAMPFLMGAKAVTVIAVNEEASEASSDQLVVHLARRGIAVRVQRLATERSDVQGGILSIAAESNMGLLVMGGYGHSRLQERILGGVTRGIFESMTVPVLMSH
ncbi:universal stress protein [Bradyrhizobium sp. CCBAU 051011]|uniref:universal stress protein n=1 Tax=Bradyrhizobium sp. CCBAU 051011 TaxID=858422 RepID=UPI001FEE0732|nr:universal stress protein [Bradyrhizobium sp. CCBAU 051011]